MKYRLLLLVTSALALAACVDTTGISADSSKPIHPRSSSGAAVVVAEYGDLQCPSCKAAHTAIVKPLLDTYGAKIRYEFHHFPLRSIHRYALEAAEASECAADQGKFWEMVDVIFEKQSDLSEEALRAWANQLKLDMDLFDRCTDSDIKRDAIMAEYDEGKDLGVTGTPTFFVNGTRVETGYDTLTKAIDEAAGAMRQRL